MKSWVGLVLAMCVSLELSAFDESPWFSRFYEIYPSVEYRLQTYSSVDKQKHCENFSSTDHFLTFGLGATTCIPKDWVTPTTNCNTQAQLTLAQTKCQGGMHANDFQILYRKPLTEDTIGDFLSSTAGLKLIQASHAARRDISVFVHGGIGLEAQLALGKEYAPADEWLFRYWALGAAGVGDTGSPWIRGDGYVEFLYCGIWKNTFLVKSLFGMGHDTLCPDCFRGYGSIRHQSIDAGWKVERRGDWLNITGGVAYRFYARNCPERVFQAIASIELPFGL